MTSVIAALAVGAGLAVICIAVLLRARERLQDIASVLDLPLRIPDQKPRLPRRVTGSEWLGPDLIDLLAARRLVSDDLPRTLAGVGGVDPFALVADPEHGPSAW